MMGSFLSRALILIFGYAYPAYECFKTVEMNKPEMERLLFWCQYWILVAVLTVCERVGDVFISWLPMYSEAKLALFIYLWHPKYNGTTYVYDSFFRPYLEKHETEIDRHVLDLKVKAVKIGAFYWKKAVGYNQSMFFEVLQYVSSHSALEPRSDQNDPTQKTAHLLLTSPHQSVTVPDQSDAETTSKLKENNLETDAMEPASSSEKGDSPQQEVTTKKSIRLKHHKWKLFRNAS